MEILLTVFISLWLNKQKENELEQLKKKYEKIIADMKRDHEQEKKFIEGEFQKKIADLEEQLKIARSGFDAER